MSKLQKIKDHISIFGLSYLSTTIQNKTRKRFFRFVWKRKAIQKNSNHSWQRISKKHKLHPSFEIFFQKLKQQGFVKQIFDSTILKEYLPDELSNDQYIIKKADIFCKNCFSILRSKEICFKKNQIPWHEDIKLDSNPKIANRFYQDIIIQSSSNKSFDDYSYDIKVPWELSRFQHLFYLGKAYEITKDEKYAITFFEQVNDWINKNPYLLGPNWVGPMEVAIRSINWVWAFHFFKNSKTISSSFWEKFVCSLYDHAHYLEHNWEKYFPTNNHYLSDLIGYFYLCFFFCDIKYFQRRQKKYYKEILKEFFKQIQDDGSSYEESSKYHKIVAEIFLHFHILCQKNNFSLPGRFLSRFEKLVTVVQDLSNSNGKSFQFGDNDSGRILTGLKIDEKKKFEKKENLKHYSNFGLSIIKDENWNITFRHPTYNRKQPSGHLHNDELAVTLDYKGIPILVDPGSYLYTANGKWRNFFRSVENHNTFYLSKNTKSIENLDSQGLFELNKIEQQDTCFIENQNKKNSLTNYHKKYLNNGLTSFRKIIFDKDQEVFEIVDWFEQNKDSKKGIFDSNWSLIFHPSISIEKQNNNPSPKLAYSAEAATKAGRITSQIWIIKFENKPLLTMESSLSFSSTQGWYSPEYGIKKSCVKLVAQEKLETLKDKKSKIIFKGLPHSHYVATPS